MDKKTLKNNKTTGLEWVDFIKKTKNRSPRQITKNALSLVKNKGQALDIGGGALNDTKYLLKNGFKVDVVDIEDIVLDISKEIQNNNLEVHIKSIEDYDFSIEKYDIIVANYVLPFVNPKKIKSLMNKIFNSLKIDGIFCGVFFGNNDFYKNRPDIIFHTKNQVLNLFKNYKKMYFSEVEKECFNYRGNLEHYHSFEIIIRKDKPRHRKGSVGLIVNSRNEFLLVNLKSFEDKYFTIPGGGVDQEETLKEAVYRELKEELNISQKDLKFVGESKKPVVFYFSELTVKEGVEYAGSEKFYFGFKFIGNDNKIKLQEDEVRNYKWVPYEDLKDYLLFDNQLEDTSEKIKEIFPNLP